MNDSAPKLVRGLGPLDATMIVVGSMIGSGIFITSAESARLVGAPGWLLAAWALAGVLTLAGALCCAELAAMMPRAGGQYVFLREAYGPATGFLFGWSLFLVMQTGTIAAVAVAFARFMGVLLPAVSETNYIIAPFNVVGGYALSLSTAQLVAIALILVLTWTNTRGLKTGKLIQNTFTFTKTAALAGLILLGLLLGWNGESAAHTSSWWNPAANGWNAQAALGGFETTGLTALLMLLGLAMVGPLFAQSAWNNVTFTGSEIREPGRNLPRALLIGCAAVVVLYLLANLAYVVTLPLGTIQKPPNSVATATMQAIMGRPGTMLMALAIMISTFGCNNGLILAGARVYYAMARDRLFFKRIGTLNSQHVPAIALIAQGVWASLLTLPRTVKLDPATNSLVYGNVYTQLLEYIVSADLVFYALMVGAVIVMRRKAPGHERPYRTFGYPLVPIIYILLALLLVVDLAILKRETSGIGYLLVLTGLPVYFLWRKGNYVLDKPKHARKKSRKQQVIAASKRREFVGLLFASIFIASTTNLLITYKRVSSRDISRNPLSSDVAIWITVFTAIVSAIGTFSTIILTWRSDRRDAREKELKIAQLERELAASSEKPALPKPKRNRK